LHLEVPIEVIRFIKFDIDWCRNGENESCNWRLKQLELRSSHYQDFKFNPWMRQYTKHLLCKLQKEIQLKMKITTKHYILQIWRTICECRENNSKIRKQQMIKKFQAWAIISSDTMLSYVNWLTWSIILQKERRNGEIRAAENTW
jgi:hypothetical protein